MYDVLQISRLRRELKRREEDTARCAASNVRLKARLAVFHLLRRMLREVRGESRRGGINTHFAPVPAPALMVY
jgi:hypothetical protein